MSCAIDRARSYLDKLPPAVSGQGGHAATFTAACALVRLGISNCDAVALLAEFNRRCQPPWSERELAHKVADARRVAGTAAPRPAKAARVTWHLEPRPVRVQALPEVTPPEPAPAPPKPVGSEHRYADEAPNARHFAGWRRDGTPIYLGTEAEWRTYWRTKSN